MTHWYRLLGVRPREKKLVGLFFAHSGLLGFGTVLVYLAASELLLSYQPARALPLAYCAGALAMLATGRLYTYWAPRWALRTLVGRALLGALGCALGLGLLRGLGPTLATVVAGLVSYRLVYLLTSLDFGSLAAALLAARPSRRLLRLGTAGELPAQALGALLAVAWPTRAGTYGLLAAAAGAFGLALLVQQALWRSRGAVVRQLPLPSRQAQLLGGGSPLVRAAGLSLLLLAAVGVGVEYTCFVRAKAALPEPAALVRYLGGGLALAYLLAALGKRLFVRHGLGWLGMRRALWGVGLVVLVGSGLGGLAATHLAAQTQLLVWVGLGLGLEVLRRAVLEPVCLVVLQALPLPERLAGYLQAKGSYEPLGLALGGVLLLGLPRASAPAQTQVAVTVGLLALGLFFALRHTYQGYLRELKATLGLSAARNEAAGPATATLPGPASPALMAQPKTPCETTRALTQLHQAEAAALLTHAEALLRHADGRVRHHTLRLIGPRADAALLGQLAATDPSPTLREQASRLACQHPAAADWLHHPDLAVRRGAIGGRLAAAPTDAAALASLLELAASPDRDCRLGALSLLSWLPPADQAALLTASLRSADPALVRAAECAAAAAPSRPLLGQVRELLRGRTTRPLATNCLGRVGAAALPLLQEALGQETNRAYLLSLAQVGARLGTPAARQLLLAVAQGDNLPARAAALRALGSLAPVPADGPCFQHLLEDEMQLAQHLLHGMLAADPELRLALRHELGEGLRRLFDILLHVYEPQTIRAAQRRALHTFGAPPADTLAVLDCLLPRPLYQGLHALLDTGQLPERSQLLDDLLGPPALAEAIPATIVRRGAAAFSAWTISVALPQWHPQPATVTQLYPHLQADNPLIRESAWAVLHQLPVRRPAAYDFLLATHPGLAALLMPPTPPSPSISARERVLLLKGTSLFADTPENVLGNLVPIMQEVTFEPGQLIFAQGSLGTSLFIVCTGEVIISDGPHQLITFHRGDFFGELALLDAEARSASATAQGPVVAMRLDQEDFYDVIEECPEVVRNILQVLCQRLRRQNEQLRPPVPVAR